MKNKPTQSEERGTYFEKGVCLYCGKQVCYCPRNKSPHTDTKDVMEWEKISAKTSLLAYKKSRNYAQFSEIIYQGFKKAISQATTKEREAIAFKLETLLTDDEYLRGNLIDFVEKLKHD